MLVLVAAQAYTDTSQIATRVQQSTATTAERTIRVMPTTAVRNVLHLIPFIMRISKLLIENFRSIQKLETDLPQICALVGPNNAGKSNILLAIQRVLGRDWIGVNNFGEEDVYARAPDRDIKIAVSFDPAIQYAKYKGGDPTEIKTLSFEYTRYKVAAQKGQRRLDQKCFDDKGKEPTVLAKQPKKGEPHQYEKLYNIPSEVRQSIPFIYIGTNRSLKEHLPSARYSLLRPLLEDIDRDLHDPAQTVLVKQADGSQSQEPRIERFRKHMEAAMRMLRTDAFIALENAIKQNALRQLGFDPATDTDKLDFFFSPFDTMHFYKSLDLLVREGSFTISATELGEGIQNALVLAILQAFEQRRKQGAILLIEEPEMFLHPQMQRSLYKTLCEIAKTNQIIYTTHSPHFVTVPDYHQVLLVRKPPDGTTVRVSDVPTDQKRREKLIKELDPERNELFFASRLLLVEGDTEKLALPEYAKQLKLDLDREGATIVEVGGKRNLPEFAKIAISFQIPTGILYDEDGSDFKDNRDEEKQFNEQLDALANKDGSVQVWKVTKNYEEHLRTTVGERQYQQLCQKYPKTTRPTRARLIAAESGLQIPDKLQQALNWLAKKPATSPVPSVGGPKPT
jgi:putative ATP-dependent endonuclease of the OLD family